MDPSPQAGRPGSPRKGSAAAIREVLETFDLTGSLRDAARLAGCSHHTVARYVAAREAGGQLDKAAVRPQLIDEFLPKVQEWVKHSKGGIRAVHSPCTSRSRRQAWQIGIGICRRAFAVATVQHLPSTITVAAPPANEFRREVPQSWNGVSSSRRK
jgi:hypothetical protein